MTHNSKVLEAFIVELLEEKKAQDIVVINPRDAIAESIIFATGRSTKNVAAIAEYLALTIKHNTDMTIHIEGLAKSEWVLVDVGDVLVNIFCSEMRTYLNLEQLWCDKLQK